jgi:hypothetical protein
MYVPMYVKMEKEYKGLGKLEPSTLGTIKHQQYKILKFHVSGGHIMWWNLSSANCK